MNRLVTKTDFGVGTLADLIVKDRFIKILEKLYEYEELEEQGLLIKLPCKVGDTVYKLEDYGEWQDVPHALIPIMCQVELIYLGDDNKIYCDLMSVDLLENGALFDEIPINEIYLSEEEAEKVLEKERKSNG